MLHEIVGKYVENRLYNNEQRLIDIFEQTNLKLQIYFPQIEKLTWQEGRQ